MSAVYMLYTFVDETATAAVRIEGPTTSALDAFGPRLGTYSRQTVRKSNQRI